MSLSKESLIGSLVEGRYLVEDELGVGGMSAVYRARDLKVHGRSVVVKVLLAEMFQNEYVVKKFRQEAEALSRLEHPNVVTIYDYGEMAGGEPYLVLQFVDGGSLRQVIRPGGVELGRAAQIVRQVSNALTAAHDKGILHRDLKPDNVMLQTFDGEERVIVIDFGIAQVQDSVIAPKTIVTATAGTMYYMSPEQLTAGALTPASDTYALGVIAYELVTGEKPFTPKSPFQLLEMQRAGAAVTPRQLRPDLPEAAEAAILRALSFDASARHQRTCEFGQDLHRAVAGLPPAAASSGPAAASGSAGTQFTTPGAPHAGAAPQAHAGEQSELRSALVTGGAFDATQADFAPPSLVSQQTEQQQQQYQPQPTQQQPAQQQRLSPPPVSSSPPAEVSEQRRRSPVALIVAAVVLLLVGAAGFVGWRMMQGRTANVADGGTGAGGAGPANAATAQPSGAPAPAAEPLTLNYSLTVQRMRDGKEYREPFESTGREIFEGGWSFRMNLSTPKPGYLYLVNEGRNESGALGYTVLHPIVGDAHLDAGQRVQLPSGKDYFFFTGEPGTEKIWVVWSEQPVAEMEALKQFANPTDQGEVGDPTQVTNLRAFFAAHASPPAEVIEDKTNKQTTVRAAGQILVHLAELEHH